MAFNSIFNTFLFTDFLNTIDNKAIEQYSYWLKTHGTGVEKSNYIGWQSDILTVTNKQINLLVENIVRSLECLKPRLGCKENTNVYLNTLWLNINKTSSFNRPHIHIGCPFSGVYYVKCNLDSGNLVLKHPSLAQQLTIDDSVISEWGAYNSSTWSIPPEEGKLVIFPSWIEHYVEPNASSDDRISIAFNAQIEMKD